MPFDAPVTTATLPSKSLIKLLLAATPVPSCDSRNMEGRRYRKGKSPAFNASGGRAVSCRVTAERRCRAEDHELSAKVPKVAVATPFRHGSYQRISCRPRPCSTTGGFDPTRHTVHLAHSW